MSNDLDLAVEQRQDATIIRVCGELDMHSAPQLREVFLEVLQQKPATHLIVDLSRATYMDSTAIGVIAGAHKRLTLQGGRLAIVVTTQPVRRLVTLTGLHRVWLVAGSVEEALEH